MRTLTWLHISDLHIREVQSHKENPVLQALLRDIAKLVEAEELRPDFIAVSGDIAHSGRTTEYKRATAFFDDLLEITSLGKDRLFVVPGNHDVDRKLISRGAQVTGNSLTDRKSVNEVLDSPVDRELMLARFKGYAWFVRYYFQDHISFDDDKYFYVRSFDLVPLERGGSYQRDKVQALSVLAGALVEAGDRQTAVRAAQEALYAAEGIGDEHDRVGSLSEVAQALVQVGQVQQALAVAERIEAPYYKALALCGVAIELAQVGEGATAARAAKEALALAEALEKGDERVRALSLAAQVLAKAGEREAAAQVAREALDAAEGIGGLIAVAPALADAARIDELERMMEAADKVRDQRSRALALSAIGQALAKAGDRWTASVAATAALASAHRIRLWPDKAYALSEVAKAMALAGQQKLAVNEAQAALASAEVIEDDLVRAKALVPVTEALVEAGDRTTAARGARLALSAAEGIGDARNRASALSVAAEALAVVGEVDGLEQALAAAEGIEEDYERALALGWMAAAFAQASDLETATRVAEQVLASRRRIALLGLNSAWVSGSPDDESRGVILGERQVRSALEQADSAAPDLTIALVHHPLDRLRPFEQQDSAVLLNDGCDFVLHGHIHQGSTPLIQGPDARATIIGAGACYETGERPRTYSFVRLNFDTDEGQIHLRTYSDRQGGFWTRDVTAFPDAPDGVYTFPLDRDREPADEMTVHESAPARVYVRELFLDNFRCFEQEDITLSQGFTVLIGDNASGKSTLLEALKVGIGAFFLGIDGVDAPTIADDQARRVPFWHGQTLTFESQYPVRVACVGSWGEQEIKWAVVSKGRGMSIEEQEAGEVANLARLLQSQVRRGGDVVLPLIAYYSTGRVWRVPQSGDPDDSYGPGSRLQGYDRCLDQGSHVGSMMEWIGSQERIAQSKGQPNEVYLAVKQALRDCVEGLTDIRFDEDERDLVAVFGDAGELPFRLLSDGVRNMLAMVADIAHRAAMLNPGFKSNAAKLTPGIVLIDEVDLHLHPEWQQHVVADLGEAFPRLQFIATTHSPLIVGSLPHDQVFRLDQGEVIETTEAESVHGWRADQILTSPAFGLKSSRDPKTEALIDTYSRLAVRDDLHDDEQEELRKAAELLGLRLPSTRQRQEAREVYEAIQDALLERWKARPAEERKKLLAEARAQLLESSSGVRRPS